MHVIKATNVNDAYQQGMNLLAESGKEEASRNGPVIVAEGPVTTWYTKPRQRVLWNTIRDANPFFHVLEALWMLNGRNDVAPMSALVGRMSDFSDDGFTFHGAYGARWKRQFGMDQLEIAIAELRANPGSRRVVVGMWSPNLDLGQKGKDFPCNLAIHFQVRNGNIDMTVFNRSNDIIMGAYGANAVHMSILQEYMANRLGRSVGSYWQVSDNYHAYLEDFNKKADGINSSGELRDLYTTSEAVVFPYICNDASTFYQEVNDVLDGNQRFVYSNSFLQDIAAPMARAYRSYKAGDKGAVVESLNSMPSGIDWTIASKLWMFRRGVEGLKNVPS
jgi:thymidylate synthase